MRRKAATVMQTPDAYSFLTHQEVGVDSSEVSTGVWSGGVADRLKAASSCAPEALHLKPKALNQKTSNPRSNTLNQNPPFRKKGSGSPRQR